MLNKISQEIFDYIFGLTVPGMKLELSRVIEFSRRLQHPHISYPIVHIAGTNGKGSTAAMLAAIKNISGVKTGLFTSPHLVVPNERIRIGHTMVPDEFIIEKVNQWKPHIEELGITFFEVLTLLGMEYFKAKNVDLAVFETGLGGRLDATNIVSPELTLITSISKDHENILGNSLEQIASEKAGIIKPKVPLILARNLDNVVTMIKTVCEKNNSPFFYVPEHCSYEVEAISGLEQKVKYDCAGKQVHVNLPLAGQHQLENFANVLVALDVMGVELTEQQIQDGLAQMRWLGRMQTLSKDPLVLYDVAHNSEGLAALLLALRAAGMEDAILIAAFNMRKDIRSMLDRLKEWQGRVIYTEFTGHSALGKQGLIEQGVLESDIMEDPISALKLATELKAGREQTICFFGSHYLAETLFDHFEVTV